MTKLSNKRGKCHLNHGEMDPCRRTLGWTTPCSNHVPERDGKDQERIAHCKRARAGSLAIIASKSQVARTCILREFFLFTDAVLTIDISGVTSFLCLVLFRFRFFAFIEFPAPRSTVLRYACAPAATRS